VVGFDDISAASWPSYNLTTVRQPVGEMIAKSIELLLEQIDGKRVTPTTVRLPAQLIVRGSAVL
jgi:DNA-binding LacI/PurR family transcriptional regulator